MNKQPWQMTIFSTIKMRINLLIKFYKDAFKDIDRDYNLILEGFTFSPKFNQKVPIIRLLGSGAYIIEPASNILSHGSYKCHLHPDDLLKISNLASEQNTQLVKITSRDISGEIYLSNGDSLNIYQPNIDDLDLNKLFTLSQKDIANILEERGFYKGRMIAKEIVELKESNILQRRNNIKRIDQNS